MKQIQRYIPRQTVVSASDINAIAAELARLGNLTAVPPLVLAETPAGPVIRYPKPPVVRPALIKEDAGAWGVISAVLVEYDGDGNLEEGESIHIRVPNVHTEGGHYWDQLAPFLKEDALVYVIEQPHGSPNIIERAEAEAWTRYVALPPFVPAAWHIAAGKGSVFATYEDTHVSDSIAADRAIRIVKAGRPDQGSIHTVKCRSGNYEVPVAVSCTTTHACVRRMNGQLLWERYFGYAAPPADDLYDAALDSAGNVIVVGYDLPHYAAEAPAPDEWEIDTAYVIDDVAVYHGIRYECLDNHTSDLTNRPRSDKWEAAEYLSIDSTHEVIKYNTATGAKLWSVDLLGAGDNGDDIIPRGVTCIGTTVYVCGEEYNTGTSEWWGHVYKLNGAMGAVLAHEADEYLQWRCIDNDGTDVYVGGCFPGPPARSRLTKRSGGDVTATWTQIEEGEMVTQVSVGNVLLWYLANRGVGSVPPRVFGARYLNGDFNGYGWCYYTAIAASGEGSWQHPETEFAQERIYVGSEFWRPPAWNAATSYSPQDIVRYGTVGGTDRRWRCWLATVGGDPGPDPPPDDAAHWKQYSFVDLNVPEKWEVDGEYEKDDADGEGTLVRDLGLRYRSYKDHTAHNNDWRPGPFTMLPDQDPPIWRAEPYQSEYFIQKILVGYHEGNPEAGDPPGSYAWPTATYWTKFTRGAPGSIMRK